MLKWAFIFFVVALIAAVFGFTEIAASAAWIGKVLCFVFVTAFAVCFTMGLIQGRPHQPPI